MKAGIYLIKNLINNKIYVGQSINVKTRISKHKSYLRSGSHENQHLQRAFNKYGESSFEFVILETCDVSEIDKKELHYIKKFDSMNIEKGYNLESGGNEGKIVSESTKEKKRGKNNPMYGKKDSAETKVKKIVSSRGKNAKLTENDVIRIKEMLIEGITQKEIGECFGVELTTINKIARFKNWQYLRPDLNEKYVESQKERKEKELNLIISLLKGNKSIREISKSTGIDRRRVNKIHKTLLDNTEPS